MSRDAWDEFSKAILVRYVLSYLCGNLYLDPSVSLKRIFAFSVGGLFSLSTYGLTCLSGLSLAPTICPWVSEDDLLGAFKQKNKLPFKLLKQQFIGRTHVLLNLGPYLNIRTLKKYMIFYTLWSRWNRTHKLWNTCVVPFVIAELGQKCLEAAPTCTKILEPLNRAASLYWVF